MKSSATGKKAVKSKTEGLQELIDLACRHNWEVKLNGRIAEVRKNTTTGKRAASKAGSISRHLEGVPSTHIVIAVPDAIATALMSLLNNSTDRAHYIAAVADLKTVAASDLGQREKQ